MTTETPKTPFAIFGLVSLITIAAGFYLRVGWLLADALFSL